VNLLVASNNSGKVKEFRSLLGSTFSVIGPQDSQFRDRPLPNVEENGATYYENALKKALEYHSIYSMPVLADDSGLEVDKLDGAPGVFSARYGGESISWRERWQKLFDALKPFPSESWSARFRCVLCYFDHKGGVPYFFEGVVEGRIVPPRGDMGFGYDPIFYYPPLGRTFGELESGDKDHISHRHVAVKQFLAWWRLDHPHA
jgi:XTP/dITP diphosphohydrolase